MAEQGVAMIGGKIAGTAHTTMHPLGNVKLSRVHEVVHLQSGQIHPGADSPPWGRVPA